MKNKFFDVVPPDKRSIRNITIPDRSSGRGEVHHHTHNQHPASDGTKAEVFTKNTSIPDGYFSSIGNKHKGSLLKFIFVLIIILIASVGASFALLKAEVTIVPAVVETDINAKFVGSTNPAPNEVTFDTITYSTDMSAQVAAGAMQNVSRKASGKIVIYNNFSTAPQTLVKNTRFQATSGKIYRIDKAVNVPGIKTVSGKKVPGSIEVSVYSDEAGESYNSKETDFTIPGFANTDKFKSIFARSSSPITGGFVGVEKVIDEAVSAKAVSQIRTDLEKKLIEDTKVRMPPEFILIPGSTVVSYSDKSVSGTGEQATISITATIKASILKKSDIERIIQNSKPVLPFEYGRVESYDTLFLTIDSITDTSLVGSISGKANIISSVDVVKVTEFVKGQRKSQVRSLVDTHPELSRASVTISPLWMPMLPSDPAKITIITEETQLTN